MPITKTVNGVIYADEFDGLSGWENHGNPGCSIDNVVLKSGSGSVKATYVTSQDPPYLRKYPFYVGPTGTKKLRFWHKTTINPNHTAGAIYPVSFTGYTITDPLTTEDWHYHKHDLIPTGNQMVVADFLVVSTNIGPGSSYSWMDKLVICQSATLTVNGLVTGQKVELYNAIDDSLLDTKTVAGGQTQVTFDLTDYEWPISAYLKVYAIDGSTLIDITATYSMYGGDTWTWSCVGGTLKVETDELVIYRQAATGTPKTATITATLKDLTGAPYVGKTIYFTTTRGDLSAGSDTTDANGEASVTLTSTEYGIGVVEAKWFGDVNVPAAAGYATIHVFYEAETGDPNEPFQFFCEGIEYDFVQGSGRYALNEEGATEDWQLTLAEWPATLTINGIVNIYRKGVKEYSGLFTSYQRALSDPKVDIGGPDISALLDNQLVTSVSYTTKTPQYMIDDILEGYPCGITAGALGECTSELTMSFDNEFIREAIERIVDTVGWKFRVNIDRTLDFAESFTGGQSGATFTEGDNLLDLLPDVNYRRVFNAVRMRGNGVTSVKQDGVKIKEQGLRMAPVFQQSISSQTTLDAACQAYLDMRKTGEEVLTAIVKDTYEVGVFGCEDQVYIDSVTLNIVGWRTVKRIERVMSDANIAILDLTNRAKDYWEIDKAYRRMVKDASV